MPLIDTIKDIIEKSTKCRIYRNSIPHGTDMYMDLDKIFGKKNSKQYSILERILDNLL